MRETKLYNEDWIKHTKGVSLFLDDLKVPQGTLYAAVIPSPVAAGKIVTFDYSEALKSRGVVTILTAKDIPGENQIGPIIHDEPLFAENEVVHRGQPMGIVVATSAKAAREARKKIHIEIEEVHPVTDEREAFRLGRLTVPPQSFILGDTTSAFKECAYIIEGSASTGAQEHLYLETQGAVAIPVEGGGVKIISSTQSPTAVQRHTAPVLGLPMHKIEVDVLRLGGGFGGKEDQASPWAIMAALAALKTGEAVKLTLPRQEDIRMTGKRNPYSADYKLGLSKEGKILAYEVNLYQNAGSSADLSPAILDRSLFHCTNSYFVPNVTATGYSCKTNLPSNTAFRGFGGPQGMFVIESALHKAAEITGITKESLQQINLLNEGDEFPYGQKTEGCMAQHCWTGAIEHFNFAARKKEIDDFNGSSAGIKKGIAVMPIAFGISFTNTMMNQASALVHIYTDGSVSISTGAIEMGQGVNIKMRQVASSLFGINLKKIKSETTNTTRNANTSPTAASSGADLNGRATEKACLLIKDRLLSLAASLLNTKEKDTLSFSDDKVFVNGVPSELTWEKLISTAHMNRVNLSAHAHYATPDIHFNRETRKGKPFAYHSFGTAIITVSVDCLRGIYTVDDVLVYHDFGKSINPVVDLSQLEGAIMQGIGWMTCEEIKYAVDGRLLTDTLSTYKVPDIYHAPKNIEVVFSEKYFPNAGVFNSKAIGEPPFMYGIGVYFALVNAIKAFNRNAKPDYCAPMTAERCLLTLVQGTTAEWL